MRYQIMGTQIEVIRRGLTPRGGTFAREFKRVCTNNKMDWAVEKAYALEIIQNAKTDQLSKCSPESVARSIIDVAVMGLTLSPAMKLAYLVPYKNSCTVSPSYMGLEQIAYATGFVEMIQTVLVYENDHEFNVWTDETGRHIKHVEAISNRGHVTHAYCIAWFSSGKQHIEVMDRADIMACRDAATLKNNKKTPFTWTGKFRYEMYKKSVMRRGWKHWPRVDNPRIADMMTAVERADPLEFVDKTVVTAIANIDQDQKDKLIEMMVNAGVDDRSHDAWLHGMASKMGYQSVSAIRVEDFEAAASLMAEGLKLWKQNSKTPPESEQVDTTAQTVET
jgi:phage RecT family recombinase